MLQALDAALISQVKSIRLLKSCETLSYHPSSPCNSSSAISAEAFSDAGSFIEHGKLSFFAGALLGLFKLDSLFYTLFCSSHKSKQAFKSIAAAEILAASGSIDGSKVFKHAMSCLLGLLLSLIVVIDSRDPFILLSALGKLVDESICADDNCIRYKFELGNDDGIIWIPGKVNLADPDLKTDRPLRCALLQTMSPGQITIDVASSKLRHSDRTFGSPQKKIDVHGGFFFRLIEVNWIFINLLCWPRPQQLELLRLISVSETLVIFTP